MEHIIAFLPKAWFIAKGVVITVKYGAVSVFFGLCLGVLISIIKLSKRRYYRLFADMYVSILRGTPLLVQLMVVYYGLPVLLGTKITVFCAGVVAFSLNSSAYVAEIIKAGINAIDRGQFDAAKVLGIPDSKIMYDIILPQAMQKILPPLINELANLLKESSIISILGEEDLMRRAQMVSAESFSFFMPMITAAICYYITITIFTKLAAYIEKKVVK